MNMIRKPNFADVSCDMPSNHFKVTVGNENGQELTRIPLEEYVKSLSDNLWDSRDTELLVTMLYVTFNNR